MNKSTKGFTLTDMLVVVSVVGMVAMMVLPKL
ncbi:MAG: prepilin-type N-terminal cleavage/methylation domain-containing protein [Phycisphaerales bacterium]|jgi:prepilin-type N-terminal cleavage/methylation domain-containing protein|nr:prepilin-type N-terminal cleavage/methylation domain-containing protein [Phycisphaerales bacterium]